MSAPGRGWRLPLRLAWRDLMRYKGRSALAALLIFVPVMTIATMLAGISTFFVSPSETLDRQSKGISALIEPATHDATATFPAAGRKISPTKPPTAEEVAKQAGVPVASVQRDEVTFLPAAGGGEFTPTTGTALTTEPANHAWREQLHLVSGRWPTRDGEVVITELGQTHGLPTSGAMTVRTRYNDAHAVVTVVGVSNTPSENVTTIGPAVPGLVVPGQGVSPSFIAASGRTWTSADEAQWSRYGFDVATPQQAAARDAAESQSDLRAAARSPERMLALATATAAFICVTALLAGPAFAAGATRQRRSLGLLAANGGTRSVLRRIVLANALLLGLITALVGSAIGSIVGVLVAQWWTKRASGIAAPADVRISWLLGLVTVSTIASLAAAWIPARAAGRTNLLQALRGQVSARRVPKRLPFIGLMAVVIGTAFLFLATTLDTGSTGLQTLLAYVGVPLFFGGAVLAVPYVLAATTRLARFLPVSARVAVRDVSRQRTRATASIGAVLATSAICTGASVFAGSVDAHDRAQYRPSMPMGTAVLTGGTLDEKPPTLAQDRAHLAELSRLTPGITGVWSAVTTNGTSSLLTAPCPSPKDTNTDPSGIAVAALDEDAQGRAVTGRMTLTPAQQSMLDRGGFLWVSPSDGKYGYGAATNGMTFSDNPIKAGGVDLAASTWGSDKDGMPVLKTCSAFHAPAMTIDGAEGYKLAGVPIGGYVAKRSTLEKHHVTTSLTTIAVAPQGGVDSKLEHQVEAAAPHNMYIQVEKGYESLLLKLLIALTAGLAVVVLLTTIVSTLLNDAESQADSATLATVGASAGLRRRIVGAHAAAIGVIGALIGIAVGITPGLIMARTATRDYLNANTMERSAGTYVVPWWPLAVMLVAVPLVAAVISMAFARRNPTLTRRER